MVRTARNLAEGRHRQDGSVESKSTDSVKRRIVDVLLRLLISISEALGRSSEDYFYAYLPLADEPKHEEASI